MIEKINSLSDDELVDYIYLIAKDLKNSKKRLNKALNNEIKSGLTTRAKSTTLVANSCKINKVYNTNIEYLKLLINRL